MAKVDPKIVTLRRKEDSGVIYPRTYTKAVLSESGASVDSLLSGKVDKVPGKQLSTEDYTTAEKEKLASLSDYIDSNITEALKGKVDKVPGKQLSTEDYTTAEKKKLAGLENFDPTDINERLEILEAKVAELMDFIGNTTVLGGGNADTIFSGTISGGKADTIYSSPDSLGNMGASEE